jgi:alpha-pyrone synthase
MGERMSSTPLAHLNYISTAVPTHDRHEAFKESLPHWIQSESTVEKLRQIMASSGIERRYTVLEHPLGPAGSGAFYTYGRFPSTQQRMEKYRAEALPLSLAAVRKLPSEALAKVTHLIVTTCTGFYAPGLDIEIVRDCGLSPQTKRTVIGFMGCYAAATGLRVAREIVHADADAVVLMVNVELCSLHLQETTAFDRLVSFLLFADGAAASIITAAAKGLRLDDAYSHLSLADADRMAWMVEDQGFAMTLDVRVPIKIKQFIERHPAAVGNSVLEPNPDKLWAVHPGGKNIIDAVQAACHLSDTQVAVSRNILRNYGNMSSATLMFALEAILAETDPVERSGHAIAFGPGLTLEGVNFTRLSTGAN